MKRGTSEFLDLQAQFEKDIKSWTYVADLSKPTREELKTMPKNQFYHNGNTNEIFRVYMLGWSGGKQYNQS